MIFEPMRIDVKVVSKNFSHLISMSNYAAELELLYRPQMNYICRVFEYSIFGVSMILVIFAAKNFFEMPWCKKMPLMLASHVSTSLPQKRSLLQGKGRN